MTKDKSDFTIEGLSECTMYTVDLSPADASGHVLQPGEDYGSVHSTFCMNKDQSSNFWFGDENKNKEDKGESCSHFYLLDKMAVQRWLLKQPPLFLLV